MVCLTIVLVLYHCFLLQFFSRLFRERKRWERERERHTYEEKTLEQEQRKETRKAKFVQNAGVDLRLSCPTFFSSLFSLLFFFLCSLFSDETFLLFFMFLFEPMHVRKHTYLYGSKNLSNDTAF